MASSGWRLGVDLSPTCAHANGLAVSERQRGGVVDSPVSLRYPNGRVHEATLSEPRELRLGDRFELYGRHWSAVESLKPSRSQGAGEPRRMLCVSTSSMRAPMQYSIRPDLPLGLPLERDVEMGAPLMILPGSSGSP